MTAPDDLIQRLGTGRPLDAGTRAFMEPRFRHDFSRVRIHADGRAAESARAVDALAYTVGRDVVFGAGRYEPTTMRGRALLAHELAHVVQQGSALRPSLQGLSVSDASDPAEAEADAMAHGALYGRGVPRASLRPAGLARQPQSPPAPSPASALPLTVRPQRGTNPADCMDEVCRRLRAETSMTFPDAANRWRDQSIDCVTSKAEASGAPRAAEIAANNSAEITLEAAAVSDSSSLFEACNRKTREAHLEFHFNVVFARGSLGSAPWGQEPAEWDDIERALEAVPPEQLWGNPVRITFSRAGCYPGDLAAGRCTNETGGVTPLVQDGAVTISIYNAGMQNEPNRRAPSVGNIESTLRHEIGHVILPASTNVNASILHTRIMQWHYFYVPSILNPPANDANAQQQQSEALRQLNMTVPQFTTWLATGWTAGEDGPKKVEGDRTFVRMQEKGNDRMLHFYKTGQMPRGPAFFYARTSPSEYLAEIYMYALSQPEWLHGVLPPEQSRFLKEYVFHTPAPAEVAVELGLAGDGRTRFLARARAVFTRQQMRALAGDAEVLVGSSLQPGEATT